MLKVKVISLPYIFQVLYVLCFTRPRYQVSVYRTNGPLVLLVFIAMQLKPVINTLIYILLMNFDPSVIPEGLLTSVVYAPVSRMRRGGAGEAHASGGIESIYMGT